MVQCVVRDCCIVEFATETVDCLVSEPADRWRAGVSLPPSQQLFSGGMALHYTRSNATITGVTAKVIREHDARGNIKNHPYILFLVILAAEKKNKYEKGK